MERLVVTRVFLCLMVVEINAQDKYLEFAKAQFANDNAKALMDQNKFKEAIIEARKGKKAFERAGWADGYLITNNIMTSAFIKSLQIDSANFYKNQTLNILRQYQIGDITKAAAYYVICNFFVVTRQLDSAIIYADKIFPLLKEDLTYVDTTGMPPFYKVGLTMFLNTDALDDLVNTIEGNTYNIKGTAYLSTYDYGQGELYFQQAARSYEKAKEYLNESANYFNQAMIYYGHFQVQIPGETTPYFAQAVEYFEKAIEAAEKSSKDYKALVGYIHSFMGKLYYLNHQNEDGKKHLDESIRLISQNDKAPLTRKCGIDGSLIEVMVKLEKLYYETEESARKQYAARATEIEKYINEFFANTVTYNDRRIQNTIFTKLARIHTNLEEWNKAYDLLNQSFQIINPETSIDLDFDDLKNAIESKSSIAGVDLDMMTFLHLAEMFEAQAIATNQTTLIGKANDFFKLAGIALEKNRPQYNFQSGLLHLGETGQLSLNYYANLIYSGAIRTEYKLEKYSVENILNYTEKAKGHIFRTRLNLNKIIDEQPKPIQSRYKDLNEQIHATWIALQNPQTNNNYNRKLPLEKKLINLQKQYDDFIRDTIAEKNKAFSNSYWQDQKEISIAEVQNLLIKNKSTILLSYAFDFKYNDIYLTWISLKETGVEKVTLPANFEQLMNQFQNYLENEISIDSEEHLSQYLNNAYELYKLLIGPIPNVMVKFKKLIVLPAAQLHRLNFEALLSEKCTTESVFDPSKEPYFRFDTLPYLIKKLNFQYGNPVMALMHQENIAYDRDDQTMDYLDYGGFEPEYGIRNQDDYDPVLNKDIFDELGKKSFESFAIIDSLRILLNGLKTKIWSNRQADERNFRLAADTYVFNVLHLSLHSLPNNREPFESRLLFYKSLSDDFDDDLTVNEIFNIRIRANLGIISSCSSGAGNLQIGEGPSSLGRGFAFAGCPSLIVGMWPLQAKATRNVLTRFFKSLRTGASVSKSLQTAKRNYLYSNEIDPYAKAPYYWSGLVLWGKDSTLVFGN